MKKIFLVIIVLIVLGINVVISYGYNYNDSDHYDFYTLSFDNLSTSNIMNYFSDISVIRIYPYVNPVYRERMGFVSYKVNSGNLSYEVNMFKEKYLSLIKKNSYMDYNYLYSNGINIEKMDVYISNEQLKRLIDSDLIITVK